MKETKVQFSNAEMDLMSNSEIILTKNKIIEKVKSVLEEVQNEMTEYTQMNKELFSKDIFYIHPKISKGENYSGLPYLILDYPRSFRQQDIFAIRTMFWWGNFFSTTLHLAGVYKLQYATKVESFFSTLSTEGYSLCINTDPWLHHFEPENYKEIALLEEHIFREECNKRHHLKIAKKLSLNESQLPDKLLENWKLLTAICFH